MSELSFNSLIPEVYRNPGARYIVARNPATGKVTQIVGPIRALVSSKGWTAAHRAAHKAANRADIRYLSQDNIVTVERNYPL